jgi:hypothetical protein
MAQSEFLMTSDVDMVFARNFVETCVSHADANRLLHCTPFWLPRNFSNWENVQAHSDRLRLGDAQQMGGCQCMSTELFKEIRGFDEYYQFWGLEDHDMASRLKAGGLEEVWLNDHTSMFHQWHPQVNMMSRGFWPGGLWGRLADHMQRHKNVVVRNSEQWGQVRTTEERSVFRFLDFAKSELIESNDLILLDVAPHRNEMQAFLAKGFWELPSGHALAVNHAFYPRRQKWVDQCFKYLNQVLYMLGIPTGVDYSPNLLHSFLIEFIERNQDQIADYYLGFPAMNGVSVLVKT